MLIPTKIIIGFIFLLLVSLAMLVMTVTIGRSWQRNELARRAAGIGTVMVLALPTILAAEFNGWESWMLITTGFVVAGVVRSIRGVIDENRAYLDMIEQVMDDAE